MLKPQLFRTADRRRACDDEQVHQRLWVRVEQHEQLRVEHKHALRVVARRRRRERLERTEALGL